MFLKYKSKFRITFYIRSVTYIINLEISKKEKFGLPVDSSLGAPFHVF